MPSERIIFSTTGIRVAFREKAEVRRWLHKVLKKEGFSASRIQYIFCSDDYLLKLNKQFLSHSTLTDILTFDYSEGNRAISGEIYISMDRVRDNAKKFQVSVKDERDRVIVHGLLHLCGYHDETEKLKMKMKDLEDHYLKLR